MEDQYNNSIIIYNQGPDSWDPLDLYNNDTREILNILQEIIKHHNYIPTKIKHNKYAIARVTFGKEARHVILTLDINNNKLREIICKDIIKLCNAHKLEFIN